MPTETLPTRPATPSKEKPKEGGFALALALHAGIISLIAVYAWVSPSINKHWGDRDPIAGSIQASMVDALPLPPKPKPVEESVLTSEKPSIAPTPPPPTPVPPKAKAEPVKPKAEPPPKPKEVLIPTKVQPKPTPKAAERETPEPPKRAPATPPPPTPKATTGETSATRIPQSTTQLKNGTSAITVEERAFGDRYAYYIRLISQKVNEQWVQEQQSVDGHSSGGKRTTITFTINRDGTPVDAHIGTRSGSPSLDSAALRAIQHVDGFGPLPQGDHISVDFSFDFHTP